MLDECQDQIGSILSTMAANDSGATLFHCYAGKDRTGVIAALLLSLVDTHHDAIVYDYTLTAEYLAERIAKIRVSAAAAGMDVERLDILFASTPYSMEVTLKHLNERHGGSEAYLRACGLRDDDMARLRQRLL
jgi:protein-tyrosine phosphatase